MCQILNSLVLSIFVGQDLLVLTRVPGSIVFQTTVGLLTKRTRDYIYNYYHVLEYQILLLFASCIKYDVSNYNIHMWTQHVCVDTFRPDGTILTNGTVSASVHTNPGNNICVHAYIYSTSIEHRIEDPLRRTSERFMKNVSWINGNKQLHDFVHFLVNNLVRIIRIL